MAVSSTAGTAFSGASTRRSTPSALVLTDRTTGMLLSAPARASIREASGGPTVTEMISPPSPDFSSPGDPRTFNRPPSMMASRSQS